MSERSKNIKNHEKEIRMGTIKIRASGGSHLQYVIGEIIHKVQ